MGRFFSVDSGMSTGINKLLNILELSVLWVLFSLPVVTFGAATTAMYYTANKVLRSGKSYIWTEFFGAFKRNFIQSTIVWALLFVILGVTGTNYWLVSHYQAAAMGIDQLYIVFIVLYVLTIIWAAYAFPYIARFENKTVKILKNSLFMVFIHLPQTLIIAVVLAVCAAAIYLVPVLLAFLPGLAAYLICLFMEPLHRRYMTPEQREAEIESDKIGG